MNWGTLSFLPTISTIAISDPWLEPDPGHPGPTVGQLPTARRCPEDRRPGVWALRPYAASISYPCDNRGTHSHCTSGGEVFLSEVLWNFQPKLFNLFYWNSRDQKESALPPDAKWTAVDIFA